MTNNTYVIDSLATTSTTITVTDDGTGIDWLVFDGIFAQPTEIRLSWTVVNGAADSASGFYFSSPGIGSRLIVSGVIENARGSNGTDFIAGNQLDNILFGDRMATGPGLGDTIGGGAGRDTIYGGSGGDTIGGDDGSDLLFGNAGNDTISGGANLDRIEGGAGADNLSGGATVGDVVSYATSNAGVRVQLTFGATTIGVGGHAEGDRINGFTNVIGSSFADVLTDTVSGTVAFDGNKNVFSGEAGNDTLRLNGGDDTGSGGDGLDTIFGGAGNDWLFGGNNNDRLSGDLGTDRLTGDAGADRFVFAQANHSTATPGFFDTIADFTRSQGDKIDISAIDAIAGGGINNFTFIGSAAFTGLGQLRIRDLGDDILVQGNISGDAAPDFVIRLFDVAGLVASDFLF